jgi:hypothetical protein
MHEDDPLGDLLRAADQQACATPDGSVDFARHAWDTHQSRQRKSTRLWISTGFVGCYLAGLLTMTMYIWTIGEDTAAAPPPDVTQYFSSDPDQSRENPEAVGRDLASSIAGSDDDQLAHAEGGLHDRAPSAVHFDEEPSGQNAYERLCKLGDEYLNRRGNIRAATECYSLALEAATADEWCVSRPEDTWLLIALKEHRRQET